MRRTTAYRTKVGNRGPPAFGVNDSNLVSVVSEWPRYHVELPVLLIRLVRIR